ncbi:MAG: IS110 family transposase [Planctomycetota bacterium]|jgi:transposase
MKLSTRTYYLGVDVCKAKLDGYDPRTGQFHSFSNTPKGLRALFAEFGSGEVHLVCEPTGGYEKALIDEAHRRGIAVSVVNARRVRDFARAKGQLAKTDAIDARTLSEYARVFEPAPQQAPSPVQDKLSAAVRRKDTLVRQMAREKNALEKATDSFVKADLKVCISHLKRRIAKCDNRIRELIESDAGLREKREKLIRVKGIGPAAAAVLIGEVPELGSITDKQASALIGVAPLNRDSGKWRGCQRSAPPITTLS